MVFKFPILANTGYINCFNLDSLTGELRRIFKQLPTDVVSRKTVGHKKEGLSVLTVNLDWT